MNVCKSCGAPIRWVILVSGRRMPVDVEPVADGNVLVPDDRPARVLDAQTLAALAPSVPRYRSHFATCAQAREWRKQ